MTPLTLADILHPDPPAEFLAQYWGKVFVRIPGSPGKFRSLLTWRRLNTLLQQLRPEAPRLRLVLDHKYLAEGKYLRHTATRRGSGSVRLDTVRMNRLLRRGANLVINAVEEVVEPIARLTENLERELREGIQVNAYVAFGATSGFNVHRDSHDVLILQVAGRKAWRVYAPSPAGEGGASASPPASPVWEGVLEDGDCLYIPRGWWHGAVALGEPTLHLTVGVLNRTGVHLLTWVHEQLSSLAVFQQDLPRFADAETQARHFAQLQEALCKEWTPDVIDRFSRDYEVRAQPGPRPNLPWSAQQNPLPADVDGVSVSLNVTPCGGLRALPERGIVELHVVDRHWSFPIAMEPLLRILLDGRPHVVAELQIAHGQSAAVARSFLTLLIIEGIVRAEEPPDLE